MITKELIGRFLKNECNAEEQRMVAAYLENHPEALDTWLPEEEFTTLPVAGRDLRQAEASFAAVQQKLFWKRTRVRRIAWSTAAAASLLIIIGLVWSMNAKEELQQKAIVQTETQESSPLDQEVRLNNTDKVMPVTLPDGSIVELAPASIIRYEKGLVRNSKRIVYLQGEGLFKVTKDKTKPFTVISDAIATTALGTSFLVTAWPSSPTIMVHLYTGKVAVAPSGTIKTKITGDLFLLPGDALTYNRAQLTASIVAGSKRNDLMAVSTKVKEQKALQPDWYKFGGQALPQVFDQLSNYYGVEINYVPADVSNRYFTGRFSQTDSIETILKDISLMHNLTLKKVNGVFVFRKRKQ